VVLRFRMFGLRPAIVLIAPVLLAGLATGCQDDNPLVPAVTEDHMTALWPNEDGRWWQYDVVTREWGDNPTALYSTRDEVPPAPSCAAVIPLLDVPFDPGMGTSASSWYELRFSGAVTTQSGVTRQNLYETLVSPGGVSRTATGSFWRMLAAARPDLRARLRQLAVRGALSDTSHNSATALLHGYAWEKSAAWIGTYGDLDTLLAWKYLDRVVTPGHEFTHQLIPAIASDVFLHGRIAAPRTVATPARTFTVTRCVYVIDFGVSEGTDDQGQPIGFHRDYNFGYVDYAEHIGPVAAYERQLVPATHPAHSGYGDVTVKFLHSGLPALAASRY